MAESHSADLTPVLDDVDGIWHDVDATQTFTHFAITAGMAWNDIVALSGTGRAMVYLQAHDEDAGPLYALIYVDGNCELPDATGQTKAIMLGQNEGRWLVPYPIKFASSFTVRVAGKSATSLTGNGSVVSFT